MQAVLRALDTVVHTQSDKFLAELRGCMEANQVCEQLDVLFEYI